MLRVTGFRMIGVRRDEAVFDHHFNCGLANIPVNVKERSDAFCLEHETAQIFIGLHVIVKAGHG